MLLEIDVVAEILDFRIAVFPAGRGGSFWVKGCQTRCAGQTWWPSPVRNYSNGFRPVRTIKPGTIEPG